jgi:hypothetical protein
MTGFVKLFQKWQKPEVFRNYYQTSDLPHLPSILCISGTKTPTSAPTP